MHQRGGGNYVLIDASQLNPTFTAAPGSRTISFTALEPWTATLEETTRTVPDWAELSSYGGEAGDVTLTIHIFKANSTDKTRTATLTILSGDSRVTIRIEQQAAGADPDNPDNPNPPMTAVKYVDRIDYLLVDNREKEQKRETISQAFEYDDRQRVSQIIENHAFPEEEGSIRYRFDYASAGKITMTVTDIFNGKNERISLTEAALDEKGRMTEATRTEYNPDGSTYYCSKETCTYDSEGRIGTWHSAYTSNGDGNFNSYDENQFFYDAEGLLTRYTYYDNYDGSGFEGTLPAAEFYPNRITNEKSNLDLRLYAQTGIIGDLDEQVLFTLLRLTGNGFGTCLPEKTEGGSDDWVTPGIDYDGWDTPNVTIHETYTYIESTSQEDEYVPLDFTMDADGCITQIAYKIPYAEYLGEYDIVVGSEPIHEEMNDPEFPESEKRYKYEIKNRKSTKQRDIINPVTISIAYR